MADPTRLQTLLQPKESCSNAAYITDPMPEMGEAERTNCKPMAILDLHACRSTFNCQTRQPLSRIQYYRDPYLVALGRPPKIFR
ncbi:hypothetical protein EJ110_NYTH08367 [Nymphaea thermarum]|nr:hypothetical protein EJ110_NYTH08367 [Nymphaea thermarum]